MALDGRGGVCDPARMQLTWLSARLSGFIRDLRVGGRCVTGIPWGVHLHNASCLGGPESDTNGYICRHGWVIYETQPRRCPYMESPLDGVGRYADLVGQRRMVAETAQVLAASLKKAVDALEVYDRKLAEQDER